MYEQHAMVLIIISSIHIHPSGNFYLSNTNWNWKNIYAGCEIEKDELKI